MQLGASSWQKIDSSGLMFGPYVDQRSQAGFRARAVEQLKLRLAPLVQDMADDGKLSADAITKISEAHQVTKQFCYIIPQMLQRTLLTDSSTWRSERVVPEDEVCVNFSLELGGCGLQSVPAGPMRNLERQQKIKRGFTSLDPSAGVLVLGCLK